MQRLAISIPMAMALALGTRLMLIAVSGSIAALQLNYGFALWYFTSLGNVLPLYTFEIATGFLLSILLCLPLAAVLATFFKTRHWLHVAVAAATVVAPDFLEFFLSALEQEMPLSETLHFAQAVGLNVLVVLAAVTLYQWLKRTLGANPQRVGT